MDLRNLLYFLVLIIVFIACIVFFLLNDQKVDVHLFIDKVSIPLSYVIIASVLLGFLLGVGSLIMGVIKGKTQLKYTRKKLASKTRELDNLRALPIKDDY